MDDRHRGLPKWVRLDAAFTLDARVMRVPLTSEVLYLRMIATSRLVGCDGHLTNDQARRITHKMDARTARKAWDALVAEGLLEWCDDGIRVPIDSWRRWQDTEEELTKARDRERDRKAQWRHRQREGDEF